MTKAIRLPDKPQFIKRVDDAIFPGGTRGVRCLYKCYCGKEFVSNKNNVINGRTRSCGCYRSERIRRIETTHGLSKSRLYMIWRGMMNRCYQKDHVSYKYYGRNGVYVVARWHLFQNFYNDMIGSYKDKLTLDRINGSKIYSKRTCKWSTHKEQQQNKSNNRIITHNGVTLIMAEWSRVLGGSPNLVFGRIKSGWSPMRAVSTPLKQNA